MWVRVVAVMLMSVSLVGCAGTIFEIDGVADDTRKWLLAFL